MNNNPIVLSDPNGDTPLHLGAAIIGGLINLGSQALKGNVTSWGEGLGYFGVGAAAGALYLTPGGQAVAGSVQVIGNKGIQIATGKFDVTEVNSVGDVATLGLDIATDYFSVAPAATIGSNLASGLQKLAGSYAPSVASGGGSVVKTAAGGTLDDITFSVSLSDEVVVSASKVGGKGVAAGASTKTTAVAKYWPGNGGALGKWKTKYLMPGAEIDRFGSGFGKYFSPKGTPNAMRALPGGNTGAYNAYRVIKPFPVQSSTIAPAFGKPGLGTQFLSPVNANTLLKRGIIVPIK